MLAGSPPGNAMSGRPEVLHLVADHTRPVTATIDVTACDGLLDGLLHRLGPTTTLLWMRLARLAHDGAADVTIDDLAQWTGVIPNVVWRSLDRLVQFTRVAFVSTDVVMVPLYAEPREHRAHRAAAA